MLLVRPRGAAYTRAGQGSRPGTGYRGAERTPADRSGKASRPARSGGDPSAEVDLAHDRVAFVEVAAHSFSFVGRARVGAIHTVRRCRPSEVRLWPCRHWRCGHPPVAADDVDLGVLLSSSVAKSGRAGRWVTVSVFDRGLQAEVLWAWRKIIRAQDRIVEIPAAAVELFTADGVLRAPSAGSCRSPTLIFQGVSVGLSATSKRRTLRSRQRLLTDTRSPSATAGSWRLCACSARS